MDFSTAIDEGADGTAASGASREMLEQRLARLLTAEHGALRRLAASYASVASDREDLLQEIAMALWRALPTFRGECSERTFLFRIAHNRCISYLSKKRPTVPFDEAQVAEEHHEASSESTVSAEQQRTRLLHAVHRLPVIHREVLVLFLEGMEYKEIAEVTGISESNVGARLSRARQRLRTLLEDQS
jgi:RNA polymerase sigma factor (sigma-70 family)